MSQRDSGRWICVVSPELGAHALEVRPEPGREPPPSATAHGLTVMVDGESNDVESFAASYRRVGLRRALDDLAGGFAIVLWDAQNDTLLCARDAIGIHPLFYSRRGKELLVSSFVGALLDQPGVSRDIDPVAAALTIAGEPLELDETLFPAARRVLPGHALEITPAGSRLLRWWDPGEPDSDRTITPREAERRFEEVFCAAVDRSLNGGAVGVFLSGGIDSAAVASVAAERSRRAGLPPPLGLALMVDHPDLDEEWNQRTITGDLGLELISTSLGEAGAGGLLAATLQVSRSESAGPADIIQPVYDHLARESTARGRTTIVNGQGGDEWLLPPTLYATDRLRRLDLLSLARLWHAWHTYLPAGSAGSEARLLLWTHGARPFVRSAAMKLASVRDRRARRLLDGFPTWLAPDATLRRQVVDRIVARTPLPSRDPYRDARRRLLDRPDRPGITEAAFASQHRTGARIAMPLLDAEVVRFLYRLPPALLLNGGRAKALARATIADRLPSFGGAWSRTVSGESYYANLIKREAPGAWRIAGGAQLLGEHGVVDEAAIRTALADGGSGIGMGQVWAVTNLDVWLRARLGRD
jgi:asparagine synthetase B (glutamine-hydrolysing)